MLDDVRTFVTVVKAGSFTEAAEVLQTSRSVISKKVSQLERRLGVRLLNRTTRRLSLTEAGARLYEQCREGLRNIDQALDDARSQSQEPLGRLYINLPMSFGILHVAPYLAEFLERYPRLQVDLNFDDRRVDMIDPGFDLSLTIAQLPDSSLAARRLGSCHHLAVASPKYLEKYGTPNSPQDLANNHIIASNRFQDSPLQWQFFKNDDDAEEPAQETVTLNANLILNNSLAIREVILEGAAVAYMPTFVMGPDVRDGKLIKLFPQHSTRTLNIYAVYPKREFLPMKSKVFLDFLDEKIGSSPVWNEGVY